MEKIINATEYTYSGMMKSIRALKERYDFLKTFSVGQSCLGREIPALMLGNAPYCLFIGGFSGNERITGNLLLMFAEELCAHIKQNIPFFGINMNKVLSVRGIIIVPGVNVDGAEISLCGASAAGAYAKEIKRISGSNTQEWRANLRGVEINRNFPSGWLNLRSTLRAKGIFAPRKSGYGGPFPESEPETAAVIELCRKYDFKYCLSFLCGDDIIYWQYGDKLPENSEKMVSIMAEYSGFKYDTVGHTSPGGGFKDYFIETYGRPAFNVCIKDGGIHTRNAVYQGLKKMLLVSTVF